jgi:threonine/homoserine/homoserine lactone efflux protein
MEIQAFFALAIGVAVLAAKPGPGMLAVASRALGQGMRPVLAFVTGTNLVKIIFFTIVVLGFTVVEDYLLFVSILVKALAAVYLIWLGIKGLQGTEVIEDFASLEHEIEEGGANEEQKEISLLENFTAGFMLTLSNPFDILFFAGILPTIVDVSEIGIAEYILSAVVIVVSDLIVAFSYAIPLSLSRFLFSKDMLLRLNNLSNVAIIIVGLIVGLSAIPANDLMAIMGF